MPEADAVKETEAPLTLTEGLTAEDIAGIWAIDEITSYRFDVDGTGALLLPEHSYAFAFAVEDDELTIQFENENIKTAVFLVSLEDGILVLEHTQEEGSVVFLLSKIGNVPGAAEAADDEEEGFVDDGPGA